HRQGKSSRGPVRQYSATVVASHASIQSHHTPMRIVNRVNGAPTVKYCQKPISTPCARACSTTIRLAIEPSTVKLPASVAAMATTSQARCGSACWAMNDLSTSTAGTLLTRLDSTAVMTLKTGGSLSLSCSTLVVACEKNTFEASAATTMNSPANSTSSCQSISR